MENKERVPKFMPGYEYLENERILNLDKMTQKIIQATDRKEKNKLIEELRIEWDKVKNESIQESESNPERIKHFLRYVAYYVEKMDKGGMNMRRTLIGDFIDAKAQEASLLFDKFLPSRDPMDNS